MIYDVIYRMTKRTIKALKLLFAVIVVTFTIVIFSHFMIFLSFPPAERMTASEDQTWSNTLWALLVDLSLLCMFMFQHSFMAEASFKGMITRLGLKDVERCLYVIMSCTTLEVLVKYWLPTPWAVLWHINIHNYQLLWWFHVVLHVYVWCIIWCGCIIMDISELLGIKQVIYSNQGWNGIEKYKSQGLLRLYSHMRHPFFSGFSIIFWIYPSMSLDRVLFSLITSLYMIKASQTTGTEPSSVHAPKLWYYDQLSFLKDQDIPRRSHSVTSVLDDMPLGEDESNDGDSADNDDHMSTGSQCSASSRSSRSFKRPLPRVDQVLEKISKQMDQPVTIPTPTEKTWQPHDAFGEYVAENMRSISASMTPFCQKLINDAILYAEMGVLNATSRTVTDEGRLPASSSGSQDPIIRAYFDAAEPYP
ncbi:nurim homolog [Anabrus simplex]|uniref:nurim homolog n=1 Tax=Anabrus simplex TaxID=316456 RepID=UPI0035A39FF9